MIAPLEPGEVKQTLASKIIIFILCACLVLSTLAYGTVHQPILALFYVFAVIVFILWAIDAWSSGFVRINRSLLQIPLIAGAIFGLFQIIPFGWGGETAGVSEIPNTISHDPYATWFVVIHLAALLIYFGAALAFIDSTKRLKRVVYLLMIFGFAFAFFAIIQYVMSPDKIYGIYEPKLARPFGSFVNPNNFAAFMEMAIAIPLGLFFAGAVERDKKLLYLTGIVLMGIALVMSGSRGGFISLVAEIFFLVLLTTKAEGYGKFAIRIGATAALIASIIVGTFLVGSEKSSLSRFAESATKTEFSTSRTHIWGVTLNIIGQNPIFGTGLNAFGVSYTLYDSFSGMERAEQAHNDYLQTLSDGGIVGGLIGLSFLILLFRTGLGNVKTAGTASPGSKFRYGVAVGALAGCFAVLVHSVADFVLHTTAIAFAFLMLVALVVASKRNGAEEERVETRTRKLKSDNVAQLVKR